jgi:SAM-dependent methyltransferase
MGYDARVANTSEQCPAASDWGGARGDRWRAQLSGMEAMLKPVDDPLIRALKLDTLLRIAEIGSGGGGTALELLQRAPVGSVVHGFDISAGLVEHARDRARSEGAPIAFEVADMASAAPPGAPYDRLVSRFGIMFFADAPAAFANLFRWLAPGGRLAFAAWGRVADNHWMTDVRAAVAEVVEIPAADPTAPGPFRYAEPDKLLALLKSAGFAELEVRDWRGALPVGGGLPVAEAASFAIASFSTFQDLLTQAGGDALTRARQALTTRFAGLEQNGVVELEARVHIFTGARPR